MNKLAIAVHGGAGAISKNSLTPELEKAYKESLREAAVKAYNVLERGGTATDAVEVAVRILEDNPLFNAGKGSVLNAEGKAEMDASIMDGRTLKAGATAGITKVRNPVMLARAIMDKSSHVFLTGKGAESFAGKNKILFEKEEYFITDLRQSQLKNAQNQNESFLDHTKDESMGTVGAVAHDRAGNLAAAASTGGMTNKLVGRVGDSPVIGGGVYANNKTCAVSCTGHGEFFIRGVVAYDISCLMEYKGYSLKEACHLVIKDKLPRLGGEGGLIAVDSNGKPELIFNTNCMFRAWKREGEDLDAAIW